VTGWPRLLETRTIYSGRRPGPVIRCGSADRMLADLPVSVVFFFARAVDEDRLARGLAEALACVPAFGGRLRERGDELEIVCGDAGVPLTVYDVDDTLELAISRVTLPGSDLVDQVDAIGARSGDSPLLSIRISRLSDGGATLGCSWHHAVGDMQSFMVLMQAWSAAVEGVAPPQALLVDDRDAYLDRVLPDEDCGRPSLRLVDPEEAAGFEREMAGSLRANRTVQIYFTDAEVARMREEFGAAAGVKLSANDVLCAHVVGTIRRLDEDEEARMLTIPVNVRRSLGIPPGAVGNLVGDINLSCAPGAAPETLAAEIRAAVAGFAQDHLCIRTNREFLEKVGPDRLGECFPFGFDPVRKTFTVSNWSRFGLYDLEFEGRRPVLLSPAVDIQLPWVASLVEGFEGTGILCTVGVPAAIAAKLRGATGRAAVHRFREPGEELPELAGMVRKLV
jgi:hypothetical protein